MTFERRARRGSVEMQSHLGRSDRAGRFVTTERERIAAAKLKVAADKLRNAETEQWIVDLAEKDGS